VSLQGAYITTEEDSQDFVSSAEFLVFRMTLRILDVHLALRSNYFPIAVHKHRQRITMLRPMMRDLRKQVVKATPQSMSKVTSSTRVRHGILS